jgi:hypothetical protein
MAPLEDVERLYDAVKLLRDERRKAAKLSEKAANAPIGKAQKFNVDLNWQAFHVAGLEHSVHAAAVDCGFADLRSDCHYLPYTVRLTGFHEYEQVPAQPRAFTQKAA